MGIKTIATCDDCGKKINPPIIKPVGNIYCFSCSMKDKNNLNLMGNKNYENIT